MSSRTLKELLATVICTSPECASGEEAIEYNLGVIGSNTRRISKNCFQSLDAPVEVLGALNVPAVPMNIGLEQAMLPNAEKVGVILKELLNN